MTKSLKIWLISLLFVITGSLSFFFYLLNTPTIIPNGVIFYLKPGTSKKILGSELAQHSFIHHSYLFTVYLYFYSFITHQSHLKTGEYYFPIKSTPISIIKQITKGTGHYYRSFIIVPGSTFQKIRQDLLHNPYFYHATSQLNNQQIMSRLNASQLLPEGNFFPDTYHYTRGNSDFLVLKHAYQLMQFHLNQAWINRVPSAPFKNAYELLIAASLIEKEAYLQSEKPIIAGVLVNRLEKKMLLQFDPTVIYGLGSRYKGKIYKSDLIDNNAYNTYLHKGLPPTPISSPDQASLSAASHPMVHSYLYFVAKSDRSHQFSNNLSEHNKAVSVSNKASVSYFNNDKIVQYLHGLFSS
jgi:UPF0755 protein